jgi:hypothetical protein
MFGASTEPFGNVPIISSPRMLAQKLELARKL